MRSSQSLSETFVNIRIVAGVLLYHDGAVIMVLCLILLVIIFQDILHVDLASVVEILLFGTRTVNKSLIIDLRFFVVV